MHIVLAFLHIPGRCLTVSGKGPSMIVQKQYLKRNEALRRRHGLVRTPWIDIWQGDCVGSVLVKAADLFESSPRSHENIKEEIRQALDTFGIWQARSPQLPLAVESTGALAGVLYHDYYNSSGPSSACTLRHAYASAILRMINGLADTLQQNRAVAASIAILCTQQLGLPSWWVDVRHEATHQQLPSLAILRASASAILRYWKQMYWDQQSTVEGMETALALLSAYTAGRAGMKSSISAKTTEDTVIYEAIEANLLDVEKEDGDPFAILEDEGDEDDENDEGFGAAVEPPIGDVGSKIGTNFNSFAVLRSTTTMLSSSKNSSKRKDSPSNTKQPPKSSKRKRTTSAQAQSSGNAGSVDGPSVIETIRDLFAYHNRRNWLSPAVACHALTTYLVWTGADGTGGALLLSSFPKQKPIFLPLITAACRAWPGLAVSLLNHLIDAVMSMEASSSEISAVQEKVSALRRWVVEALLSKGFVLKAFPWLKAEVLVGDSSDDAAAFRLGRVVQRYLRYPLNSLCDRLEGHHKSLAGECDVAKVTQASRVILQHMLTLLGNERIRNHGLDNSDNDDAAVEKKEKAAKIAPPMSLDEMEHLLKDDSQDFCIVATPPPKSPVGDRATRNPWVQCSHWDSCAIGSLPGHPM